MFTGLYPRRFYVDETWKKYRWWKRVNPTWMSRFPRLQSVHLRQQFLGHDLQGHPGVRVRIADVISFPGILSGGGGAG